MTPIVPKVVSRKPAMATTTTTTPYPSTNLESQEEEPTTTPAPIKRISNWSTLAENQTRKEKGRETLGVKKPPLKRVSGVSTTTTTTATPTTHDPPEFFYPTTTTSTTLSPEITRRLPGRPRKDAPVFDDTVQKRLKIERDLALQKVKTEGARDIHSYFDFSKIDWKRRLEAKKSLQFYCKTYFPNTFYLDWSSDQQKVSEKIEQCCINPAYYAVSMPRGGGKTAMCRGGIHWAATNGYKHNIELIGATDSKSTQSLRWIRTQFSNNPLFSIDFPEVAIAFNRLGNKGNSAGSQTFNGRHTFIEWGDDHLKLPCILLSRELVKPFLDNDPESIIYIPEFDCYMPTCGGTSLKAVGITGDIRGEANIHPYLLSQPRPDFVIIDDAQKDVDAGNPLTVHKLSELIDGAVRGMEGPDIPLSIVFPCTIQFEGDLSSTYLDHEVKPEYQGEIYRMVESWPEGITDEEMNPDSLAGERWLIYNEKRIASLKKWGDVREATEWYDLPENRMLMDAGFKCSWAQRKQEKKKIISAQQLAMNLRFENPRVFLAEYQNKGKPPLNEQIPITKPDTLSKKITQYKRGHVPIGFHGINAFIDVQDEVLFYSVMAFKHDMTSYIIDYGTFPNVPRTIFNKRDCSSWRLLTRLFAEAYPDQYNENWTSPDGKKRANVEAKIYHALSMAVAYLIRKPYYIEGEPTAKTYIQKIGIDTQGIFKEPAKRFCREWTSGQIEIDGRDTVVNARDLILPCQGIYINPRHKQYEEYNRMEGWLFENDLHPEIEEPKWVWKPEPNFQYVLQGDTNRAKTFLMKRIEAAPGTPGSLYMFHVDDPMQHYLYAQHVCGSEYATILQQIKAEGISGSGLKKKVEWLERDGRPDNDWLDTTAWNLQIASYQGASLKIKESAPDSVIGVKRLPAKKKFSDTWKAKQDQNPMG